MILPSECLGDKLAGYLVEAYLRDGFDNEERNMIRIEKLRELDIKYAG